MLVSRADVITAAQGHAPALQDGDGAFLRACVATAEGVLTQYLGYPPVCHVVTAEAVWHGAGPLGLSAFTVGPASVPLTYGHALDARGRLTFAAVPADGLVRYVAGWRPYEGDTALTDAELLAVLTTDGPVLGADGLPIEAADLSPVPLAPAAVRSALAEAACAVAYRLAPGLVGVRESTVDLGMNTRTTTSAAAFNDVNTLIGRTSEVHAIIASRCAPYRYVHV